MIDDDERLIPPGASSEDEEIGYESNGESPVPEPDALVRDAVDDKTDTPDDNEIEVPRDQEEKPVVESERMEDVERPTSGRGEGAGQRSVQTPRRRVRRNVVVPITLKDEDRIWQAEIEKLREMSGSVTSKGEFE